MWVNNEFGGEGGEGGVKGTASAVRNSERYFDTRQKVERGREGERERVGGVMDEWRRTRNIKEGEYSAPTRGSMRVTEQTPLLHTACHCRCCWCAFRLHSSSLLQHHAHVAFHRAHRHHQHLPLIAAATTAATHPRPVSHLLRRSHSTTP